MYEDAEGLPQDNVKAAEWYRVACENRPDRGGSGQGCNRLGLLYLEGKVSTRNLVEAYKYFKIAGVERNVQSVRSLMTADKIDLAERQTTHWMELHPDPWVPSLGEKIPLHEQSSRKGKHRANACASAWFRQLTSGWPVIRQEPGRSVVL